MPGVEEVRTTAVVDASVVVRWLTAEPGSDQAAALLRQPISWLAPRLMVTEVSGALRRKVVGGEISADAAADKVQGLLDFIDNVTIRLVEDEHILMSAFRLSLVSGHNVADCIYLALAERDGVDLVTADVAMARISEIRGVTTQLLPSS